MTLNQMIFSLKDSRARRSWSHLRELYHKVLCARTWSYRPATPHTVTFASGTRHHSMTTNRRRSAVPVWTPSRLPRQVISRPRQTPFRVCTMSCDLSSRTMTPTLIPAAPALRPTTNIDRWLLLVFSSLSICALDVFLVGIVETAVLEVR